MDVSFDTRFGALAAKSYKSFAMTLAIFSSLVQVAIAEEYPNADLLMEPGELAKEEIAENYVILDVRSSEAYDTSHIPSAHRIDHDAWKSAFSGNQNAEAWSERIGSLGIGKDTSVVIYDEVGMKDAARIWWLLRYWGVENVRLLNGGWKTWSAQDLATTKKPTPAAEPVPFRAVAVENRLTNKDQILKLLEGGSLQIVDARSFDEHCGLDPRKNQKGGAIPGAKHLEWSDLVDADTHRFKKPTEIRALMEKAGIDPKIPTATHCQSGGRASVMAFGVELMGGEQVQNYYQGWSEWGNAEETPVEKQPVEKQPQPVENQNSN